MSGWFYCWIPMGQTVVRQSSKDQINLSKEFQFVIRYWLDFDLNAMKNGVHSLAT